MRFSIRYQLFLPLFLLILGVVGIGVWTAWASAERARQQIEAHMDAVAETARTVTLPRNVTTLRQVKGLSGVDLLLCDQNLRPLPDDKGGPITTLAHVPEYLPPLSMEVTSGLGVPVEVKGKAYFCRASTLGDERSPGFILFQFFPEDSYRDAIWQAILPGLILGLVGGLTSILLTVTLTHRMTRRIQELERTTRLIASGDFSPMPLPHRNDELRDLAGSVNGMATQLAQFQETVRVTERLRLLGQVSGGLAHQLRNGVTGAKLAVQLHARECPLHQEEEPLRVALRQLALVELHLKRFLDLGRAGEIKKQSCDLGAILRETMALLGPQCRHAHIDLRWQSGQGPEGDWILQGDPGQLQHLFLNLLTNALEAGGPESWVEVSLKKSLGEMFSVCIRDSGPGPDPQVAPKLFEPFVTGKPEGVGLGLAVARQVVQAHGGTICWGRENGTTCFVVDLPLSSPHGQNALRAAKSMNHRGTETQRKQ